MWLAQRCVCVCAWVFPSLSLCASVTLCLPSGTKATMSDEEESDDVAAFQQDANGQGGLHEGSRIPRKEEHETSAAAAPAAIVVECGEGGTAARVGDPPAPIETSQGGRRSSGSFSGLVPSRSCGEEEATTRSCSLSSSPVEKDSVSSSATDAEEGEDDSKEKGGRSGKRDRSKLRKGKWTVRFVVGFAAVKVREGMNERTNERRGLNTLTIALCALLQIEEEEYTSRIIHYFNTGLLTLPEGATLRSYLAEKLNCDPMRVTKKYAGASCLGRRVYHFHNRPQPTIAQIQLAKAELDLLEQRFHQRVEEGRSGLPSPSSTSPNLLLSMNLNPFHFPPPPPSLQASTSTHPLASVAALQSLLLNFATATAHSTGMASPLPPPIPSAAPPPMAAAVVAPTLPTAAAAPLNLLGNNNNITANNPILEALGLQ